ncbi:DNA-binding GntR family transcriptional regulator [Anaerosolibacter carboniphilus]|uniref:DNA-binding GntR family transcriptional regulator n=1 Tax=Anaerosolibacter carboniphilus TaxID=1417629 RepID=A0A841L2X6_9FIRM|nr:GntR family transcriptional regulator [Anaerosolibacter carboniphilus]MBB6218520.1 DNA-binding GntR family transcriptional regulator [Anaerosolibacter carboniphilus]
MKNMIEKQLPLKERAYNLIKEKIVKCEWMPGSDISEAQIAEELGISRTPVREAILRLNQEKFITIYPRKGMIVSPISAKDIHEVFQIREMVEPHMAKLACRQMSAEYLLSLKEKFDNVRLDLGKPIDVKYFDLDLEFHKYIVQSGNNQHLIRFTNEIYDLDYRIRVMSTLEIDDVERRSRPEHFAIIDALVARDEEKIEKTIKEHLSNARKAALMKIF